MSPQPHPTKDNALREQGEVGNARSSKGEFSAHSTSTEAQIARLINCLRRRPHHTHELRGLGISHPAGRIGDLINRGFAISSERINTVDSDGFTHVNVAIYSLVSEPGAA